ncbi:unnamed protein product [Phyllotreta striolata]|uniref:KIF-binding protein n=1 Tax=Phyllotreta striolata TaxID=444603 RepID=A0A9N9TUL1_PHYSR|nr:unnamed protein product [Phyllotreta striolata]
MGITKETFVDLYEKYSKVLKLLGDNKPDPDTEPYLSQYSARQILIGMKASIENLMRHHSDNVGLSKKLKAMLAWTYLYLGMIGLSTEEISAGKKHLEKCNEIIDDTSLEPEMILIAVNMYNQFGIQSHCEAEESHKYLVKAEKLYMDFKRKTEPPIDTDDLFQENLESYNTEAAVRNLEKIHTLTLYYLAQIYVAMKEPLKSIVYFHLTLQRQLELQEFDDIDWALNAATLSQFLIEKDGFKQGRHHLAASSCILDKYKQKLDLMESSEAHDALVETFKHRSADVARCWMKYGLLLLSKSKERLLKRADDDDDDDDGDKETDRLSTDFSHLDIGLSSNISEYDPRDLYFKNIDVSHYENQITDQFILTLPDAKKVFLNAQQWSQKAQEYYTLETLASDFIQIMLDQTQLYLNLVFFEDDPETQAKLHKRRIKLLEHVLNSINPQYYLNYCRQIWFELATTYSDISDIKSDVLKETEGRPAPHSLVKINNLIENGILHYSNFIDSFEDKLTKKLPDKIEEDLEKPFLRAAFHRAALYGRYISLDKQVKLKNTELSLENYKFVYDYCERNSKAKDLMPMEYGICKEMVLLLPIKILKLKT